MLTGWNRHQYDIIVLTLLVHPQICKTIFGIIVIIFLSIYWRAVIKSYVMGEFLNELSSLFTLPENNNKRSLR